MSIIQDERSMIAFYLADRWLPFNEYDIDNLQNGGFYSANGYYFIWLRHSEALIELTKQELLERFSH